MTSCEPGRFCPDHGSLPGVLALVGIGFLTVALAHLAVLTLHGIRALARHLTRRRRTPPADGTPGHLTVIAAALDDYRLLTDPTQRYDSTEAAEHVHMYLASSGYHITPNP